MVNMEESGALVTLRFHQPYEDAQEYLHALRRVETRERPFAMLSIIGVAGAFSVEDEREQALWFKRSRDRMNRLCRGMAVVRPQVTDHMRHVFTRLWDFPVLITTSENEARVFLAPYLDDTA